MAINHAPAALSSGTLVNERFRVKKVLGAGGYGNVYLVEDEIVFPGNKYALKESLSSTNSEQRQFTREAKWLTSLEHPNLPRVMEQFTWNSRPYFVMAYVEGENLEDRVDNQGALDEKQVLAWMLPICTAVIYLHTQKRPIIHRDIKPGNIIVSKDGRPWLVDFGIAKMMQPRSRKTTRAARAVSGGYSPLEQYTQGGTDVRSDVYALGATLYHLLTGICPPEAPDIVSGVARLPDANQVQKSISSQTNQVIMRAMRQKPDERYQTVRELMDELPGGLNFTPSANGTAPHPVVAKPPSPNAKKKNPPAAMPPFAPAAEATSVGAAMVALPPSPGMPAPLASGVQPPAATLIGPPPAASLYMPPAAAPGKGMPQPVPYAAPGTQPYITPLPQPGVLPVEKLKPPKRRRVVWAALIALLCGLLVLLSMVMTFIYSGSGQPFPWYVQGYRDILSHTGDLSLYALFIFVPFAAVLLAVFPLLNWFGGPFGRPLTYMFLLLAPLIGLTPIIAWFITQNQFWNLTVWHSFFAPIVLFVAAFITCLFCIFRGVR